MKPVRSAMKLRQDAILVRSTSNVPGDVQDGPQRWG